MKLDNHPIVVEPLLERAQVLDRFLTKKEVLRRIGLSTTTLYKFIKEGKFPKQIKISHCTSVVWSEVAVHQWMENEKMGNVKFGEGIKEARVELQTTIDRLGNMIYAYNLYPNLVVDEYIRSSLKEVTEQFDKVSKLSEVKG